MTRFGGKPGDTVWRRVGWPVLCGKRRRDARPWLPEGDVVLLKHTTACPRRNVSPAYAGRLGEARPCHPPLGRSLPLAVLIGVLSLAIQGCDHSPTTATTQPHPNHRQPQVTDMRDWVIDPPVVAGECNVKELRLVCMAPNVTEICCALGLRAQIVGRTRFCDYPPELHDRPIIGALDETNLEVLLALEPDLILVAGTSRAITTRLDRLQLHFKSLPDDHLADVFTAIIRIGELTGRRETARRLCTGIRADLKRIARRYQDQPAARVLILLGPLANPPAPPFVAGPGSFYDDLLRRAGHINVTDEGALAYGPFSLEAIVRADPDVIIELDADGRGRTGGDTEALRVWSLLGPLRAVTEKRIHVLKGRQHHLLGPRIAQTFASLCALIAEPRNE